MNDLRHCRRKERTNGRQNRYRGHSRRRRHRRFSSDSDWGKLLEAPRSFALSPILGRRKSCNEKLPPFSYPPALDIAVFSPGANEREKKWGGGGREERERKEKKAREMLSLDDARHRIYTVVKFNHWSGSAKRHTPDDRRPPDVIVYNRSFCRLALKLSQRRLCFLSTHERDFAKNFADIKRENLFVYRKFFSV